jgi:hypothetical protein
MKVVADESQAFRLAARQGHTKVVEFLLPYLDPKSPNSEAIRSASRMGYVSIVDLIAAFSDVNALNNEALRDSIRGDNLDVVKILLEFSKPNVLHDEDLELDIWQAFNWSRVYGSKPVWLLTPHLSVERLQRLMKKDKITGGIMRRSLTPEQEKCLQKNSILGRLKRAIAKLRV